MQVKELERTNFTYPEDSQSVIFRPLRELPVPPSILSKTPLHKSKLRWKAEGHRDQLLEEPFRESLVRLPLKMLEVEKAKSVLWRESM